MTGWERNAKRLVKAAIWAVLISLAATLLEVELTWRVFVLIVVADLIGFFLGEVWPTGDEAGKSVART